MVGARALHVLVATCRVKSLIPSSFPQDPPRFVYFNLRPIIHVIGPLSTFFDHWYIQIVCQIQPVDPTVPLASAFVFLQYVLRMGNTIQSAGHSLGGICSARLLLDIPRLAGLATHFWRTDATWNTVSLGLLQFCKRVLQKCKRLS
jgi:hypothetical protein